MILIHVVNTLSVKEVVFPNLYSRLLYTSLTHIMSDILMKKCSIALALDPDLGV